MAEADKAFKSAQRLITDAVAEGAYRLDLNTLDTRALTTLPPEIAGLSDQLPTLDLTNTQIPMPGWRRSNPSPNCRRFSSATRKSPMSGWRRSKASPICSGLT